MKDIDFDELDKAMNSLMGGVQREDDQQQPTTLTIASTLKEDEKPHYNNIEQVAERIGGEAIVKPLEKTEVIQMSDTIEPLGMDTSTPVSSPAPQPAATAAPVAPVEPIAAPSPAATPEVTPPVVDAPRPAQPSLVVPSRGRFMDVVHPSSDMMPSRSKAAAPQVKPLNAATPVSPLGDQVPVAKTDEDTEETPHAATVSHEIGTLAPSADVTLPEPETTTAEAENSDIRAIEDMPQPELPQETTVDESVAATGVEAGMTEPLSTPFLADAKVDKRPLGGGQADDQMTAREASAMLAISEPTTRTPASAEVMPDELRTDVVALESASDTGPAPQMDMSEPTLSETVPASGAIFDTQEYHAQPVAHPAKQSSSWIWIVIALVVIALCAAGGVAAYLMLMK